LAKDRVWNQRGTTLACFLRYPSAVLGSGLVDVESEESGARILLVAPTLLNCDTSRTSVETRVEVKLIRYQVSVRLNSNCLKNVVSRPGLEPGTP